MVPLANLAAADADALLRRAGLGGADAARITRFTHGHPLALRLAASARGARPDLTVPDAAVATVVTELARVYLSGLDQRSRAVLDAACTLRRPTMSLLGAVVSWSRGRQFIFEDEPGTVLDSSALLARGDDPPEPPAKLAVTR